MQSRNSIYQVLMCLSLTMSLSLGLMHAADHGHDHGHSHGHSHGHNDAPAQGMGVVNLAGVQYVVASHGPIAAGKEAVLTIGVKEGSGVAELRVWVGLANGRGSVKSLLKADAHGHYHGHIETPAVFPEGAALWLEIIDAAGNRQRASLALAAQPSGHTHQH